VAYPVVKSSMITGAAKPISDMRPASPSMQYRYCRVSYTPVAVPTPTTANPATLSPPAPQSPSQTCSAPHQECSAPDTSCPTTTTSSLQLAAHLLCKAHLKHAVSLVKHAELHQPIGRPTIATPTQPPLTTTPAQPTCSAKPISAPKEKYA
jgi:hypothetical protein